MTTAELIEEARKLDAAATPGPWAANRNNVMATESRLIAYTGSESFPYDKTRAAAAFIARSRTLLPQLADAYVAFHAKVREKAVVYLRVTDDPRDGRTGHCYLCGYGWAEGDPEAHAPDCPARPMEPGT